MTLWTRLIRSAKRRRSEFFRRHLNRIGDLRITHAAGCWGYSLLDDLDKLENPQGFEMIFDVGANQGDVTKLFLGHFPNAVVHALEPVNSSFVKLQKALRLEPRATIHRLAAGDQIGKATMRTFAASGLNTMVADLQDGMREGQTGEEEVETCRLDDLMNKFKISKVDLLKIDVEGFERKVLSGCGDKLQSEIVRYIFFECHAVTEVNSSRGGHTELCDIDQLLTARGYRFITLYTEGIALQEPIGSYNALYGPIRLSLTKAGPPVIG
jgi:FkbM family methyltransferase